MKTACLMLFAVAVSAAPMLRLSQSVVRAYAAVGTLSANYTLLAVNAGDGNLSPSVSVSPAAPWLVVTVGAAQVCPASFCVGAPQQCYFSPGCIPINFAFLSTSLAAGTYTARMTVSDPNAIDSPQVVIVMLQVGVTPINPIDGYVTPGTQVNIPIPGVSGLCFPPCPTMTATTSDGGPWLVASLTSQGTILYDTPVELVPPAGMATGTYTGNVAIGPPN
jgi:hypothetical protein